MKVFEDIMIQSKKLAEEQRRSGISRNPRDPGMSSSGNIYDGASGSSGNGSRMDEDLQGVSMTGYDQQRNSAWNPEANEQRQELEREKEYSQTGSEYKQFVEHCWRIRNINPYPYPQVSAKPRVLRGTVSALESLQRSALQTAPRTQGHAHRAGHSPTLQEAMHQCQTLLLLQTLGKDSGDRLIYHLKTLISR
jgi:hypothetical protein